MTSRSIESIDLKMHQLKNRRSQLLAKQSDAERKRSTRQAIIIGKWIMTKQAVLAAAIPHELERDQDRAAFGLPPIPATRNSSPLQRATRSPSRTVP